MTAPTKEPGTAVAKATRASLTPDQQAQIDQRRAHSLMVQQIKGTVWAKEFDAYTIRAVAEWARRNDVEPVTEIDVLGGNLYINARYFHRQLSRLIGAGQIEYARVDWVHADERLEALAEGGDQEAAAELRRRMLARIQFNLSDKADAACVARIKHRQMTEEVTGAKEHIPGRKRKIKRKDGGSFEVDADPVGDASPAETIETRAIRRAMLKLKEAFPALPVLTSKDEDVIGIQEIIESARDEVRATPKVGDVMLQQLPAGDPYDAEAEPVRAVIRDPDPPEIGSLFPVSEGQQTKPKQSTDAIANGH